MNFTSALNSVRSQSNLNLSVLQKLLRLLYFFLFGIISGVSAKYLDTVVFNDTILALILNILGDLFTGVGVWIFIATLISIYSRNPRAASVQLFTYFMGMLISYYIYSMYLFGFFPTSYFFIWGSIAVASMFFAYVLWYGYGHGMVSKLIGAIPIVVLVRSGWSAWINRDLIVVDGLLFTSRIAQLFDLIFAFILVIILYKDCFVNRKNIV